MKEELHFNTATIHGGQSPDKAYGAVMPPIYQTSTYAQKSPGKHKGFEYSRTHNPTREALEKSLASIESGNFAFAFGSGLAAMDAVLKTLKPGDEIISTDDLYGGSYRLFTKIFKDFGLKFHFVSMHYTKNISNVLNVIFPIFSTYFGPKFPLNVVLGSKFARSESGIMFFSDPF